MSSSFPVPSVQDLESMDPEAITSLLIRKWKSRIPCEIRFSMKPKSPLTFADHTGILMGCRASSRSKIEFLIYFNDPLDSKIKPGDRHADVIADRTKRKPKVFAGGAFSMTCYYHHEFYAKTKDPKTTCTRDFNNAVELQLKPGDDKSWTMMDKCFPKSVRTCKDMVDVHNFLSGRMDKMLPVPNDLLKPIISELMTCTHLAPVTGRRGLSGCKSPSQESKVQEQEASSDSEQEIEKSKAKSKPRKRKTPETEEPDEEKTPITERTQRQSNPDECPGCDRHANEWTDLDLSFMCCEIHVCKSCDQQKSDDWSKTQADHKSCFGSWLSQSPCGKWGAPTFNTIQDSDIPIFDTSYHGDEFFSNVCLDQSQTEVQNNPHAHELHPMFNMPDASDQHQMIDEAEPFALPVVPSCPELPSSPQVPIQFKFDFSSFLGNCLDMSNIEITSPQLNEEGSKQPGVQFKPRKNIIDDIDIVTMPVN